MAGLLYDAGSFDSIAVTMAVTTLITVALAAAWIPARRAASVDPTVVLRSG